MAVVVIPPGNKFKILNVHEIIQLGEVLKNTENFEESLDLLESYWMKTAEIFDMDLISVVAAPLSEVLPHNIEEQKRYHLIKKIQEAREKQRENLKNREAAIKGKYEEWRVLAKKQKEEVEKHLATILNDDKGKKRAAEDDVDLDGPQLKEKCIKGRRRINKKTSKQTTRKNVIEDEGEALLKKQTIQESKGRKFVEEDTQDILNEFLKPVQPSTSNFEQCAQGDKEWEELFQVMESTATKHKKQNEIIMLDSEDHLFNNINIK